MLYIVRVFEDNDTFEYEYGNMDHALEQYTYEKTADILEYKNGEEKLVRKKIDGEERGVHWSEHVHSLWTQRVRH